MGEYFVSSVSAGEVNVGLGRSLRDAGGGEQGGTHDQHGVDHGG